MTGFDEELGLDKELGLTEETSDKGSVTHNISEFREPKKVKKPFHFWNVGGEEYRLKLTTQMVIKLEDKYRCNLLNILSSDGMPRLSVMLVVIQAAMEPWRHGTKYKTVQDIYNQYLEEGGSQIKLLSGVVMPTMAVSGFFTESQAEDLMDKMSEMEDAAI